MGVKRLRRRGEFLFARGAKKFSTGARERTAKARRKTRRREVRSGERFRTARVVGEARRRERLGARWGEGCVVCARRTTGEPASLPVPPGARGRWEFI